MNTWRILHGDVREQLRTLPDACVQTCVTSPPYFGLRDYGDTAQIGHEPTPDAYVEVIVSVFREVRRALKDDGTLWLNLGDSYAGSWGAQGRQGKTGQMADRSVISARQINAHRRRQSNTGSIGADWGCKPKDLIGIPWRVAFALQADGWYLRQAMPWIKRNGMPESVTDRPTISVEQIFLLSKSADYFYDSEATVKIGSVAAGTRAAKGSNVRSELKDVNGRPPKYWDYTGTRLRRASDWFFESLQGLLANDDGEPLAFLVNTIPYPGAHFAVFPEGIPEPCILAGSRAGDTVLDPFNGSGTTGAVAIRHNRDYIGCELNAEYIALARQRIGAVSPLFAHESATAVGAVDPHAASTGTLSTREKESA